MDTAFGHFISAVTKEPLCGLFSSDLPCRCINFSALLMRILFTAFWSPLLFIATGAIAQVKQPAIRADTAINRLGASYLRSRNLTGLSIGLYDNGITYFYNFGTTEAGLQRVPTPATIYEIGSISKTFTSLLLAHAVLEKKLKLTDDIRQYLPGHYPNPTYQGQPIRLVHLANTTAGLPDNLPDKPEIFKHKDPDSTVYLFNKLHQHYRKEAFYADLGNVTLTRVPGTQPAHSNVAAELLGYILENVYHTSYAALVQRYITGPLRMASTTVAVPASQRPLLAKGHNKRGKVPDLSLADLQAAGGLHASPADMVAYLRAQLAATDPAIRLSHRLTYGNPTTSAIGLNWAIAQTADSKRTFSHSGGTYGFASYSTFCPALHRGMVLLTNKNDGKTEATLADLAAAIVDATDGVPAGLQALRLALQQRGFVQAAAVYARLKQQHPELYLAEDYVNNWGYSLLRQGQKQSALELFKFNVQLYPASANTYDSLAEVYEATGDGDSAIQNYRRSLLLNPTNTNATEHLQKLVAAGTKSNGN